MDGFRETYPDFKLDQASTKGSKMVSEDSDMTVFFNDNQAWVAGDIKHTASLRFGELSNHFFSLIAAHIGISVVTKIGNRTHHRAELPTEAAVDEWLSGRGAALFRNPKPFGRIDEKLADHSFRDFSIRTRDELFEIDINLKKLVSNLSIQGDAKRIFGESIEKLKRDLFAAEVDIDVRTRTAVPFSSVDAAMFFESNRRLVYNKILPWVENPS